MKNIFLLINLFFSCTCLLAQPLWVDSINVISHAQKLNPKRKSNFKILHIGDSHIQADIMTHTTRDALTSHFGNGGTGLIFPYKSIKTNGQQGYKTTSNTLFNSAKLVKCKSTCNVGLMAYNAYLSKNQFFEVIINQDSALQQLTVYYESVDDANELPFEIETIYGNIGFTVYDTGSVKVAVSNVPVRGKFLLKALKPFTFFGIALSAIDSGIWYGVTGANSAKLSHFNYADVFFKQLKLLQPDVIVVSIGTNESYDHFNPDSFVLELNNFITNLGMAGVNAPLIFTTPANNYKAKYAVVKKKVKGKWKKQKVKTYANNPYSQAVARTISEYCAQHQIMCWNWFDIMGGDGAMKIWVNAGLASKDYIHFKKAGYQLQGKLFYEALIKSVLVE